MIAWPRLPSGVPCACKFYSAAGRPYLRSRGVALHGLPRAWTYSVGRCCALHCAVLPSSVRDSVLLRSRLLDQCWSVPLKGQGGVVRDGFSKCRSAAAEPLFCDTVTLSRPLRTPKIRLLWPSHRANGITMWGSGDNGLTWIDENNYIYIYSLI